MVVSPVLAPSSVCGSSGVALLVLLAAQILCTHHLQYNSFTSMSKLRFASQTSTSKMQKVESDSSIHSCRCLFWFCGSMATSWCILWTTKKSVSGHIIRTAIENQQRDLTYESNTLLWVASMVCALVDVVVASWLFMSKDINLLRAHINCLCKRSTRI